MIFTHSNSQRCLKKTFILKVLYIWWLRGSRSLPLQGVVNLNFILDLTENKSVKSTFEPPEKTEHAMFLKLKLSVAMVPIRISIVDCCTVL
jgi:hypothetical protein